MNPVILTIPIYFLLIGIELLVQYFSGKKLYRLSDAVSNISCGIVQQLSGIFLKVLSVGVYTLVYTYFRFFTIEITWITWVVLFIGVDFFYYWAHRMSHEINLFWGGHVVHHQSEDYNFSVALRQSSFQVVWTFVFYMPLALVGFDPLSFLFVNALTTIYQFWIHTETIGKLGPLEWVFNTPSHHRVHHGRNPKYIDRNHAGVFIIWDKMFGTFQVEEERPVYGITTPLKSWNPVWANFDHYGLMWKELKQVKGLKHKLLYLVKKPGWLPADQGGYRPAPEVVPEEYVKFEIPTSKRTGGYVLMQYLFILGITAVFLFNISGMENFFLIVISAWIILSVASIGAILERRRWGFVTEFIRHLILTLLILTGVIAELFDYRNIFHLYLLVTSAFSFVHFFFIYEKDPLSS